MKRIPCEECLVTVMCNKKQTVNCVILLEWIIRTKPIRGWNFWSQIQNIWGPNVEQITYLQTGEILFRRRD